MFGGIVFFINGSPNALIMFAQNAGHSAYLIREQDYVFSLGKLPSVRKYAVLYQEKIGSMIYNEREKI